METGKERLGLRDIGMFGIARGMVATHGPELDPRRPPGAPRSPPRGQQTDLDSRALPFWTRWSLRAYVHVALETSGSRIRRRLEIEGWYLDRHGANHGI